MFTRAAKQPFIISSAATYHEVGKSRRCTADSRKCAPHRLLLSAHCSKLKSCCCTNFLSKEKVISKPFLRCKGSKMYRPNSLKLGIAKLRRQSFFHRLKYYNSNCIYMLSYESEIPCLCYFTFPVFNKLPCCQLLLGLH